MSNDTDYTKANEFMAEECGVEISTEYWAYKDHRYWGDWNIKCAVCREIIREHYKIETEVSRGFFVGWLASEKEIKPKEGEPYKIYEGKTIAEAEVACILAIVEEQDNG